MNTIPKLKQLLACKREEFLELKEEERAAFIDWLDDFFALAEKAERQPVVAMKILPSLEAHCPGRDRYLMYRVPPTILRRAVEAWANDEQYEPSPIDIADWVHEGQIQQSAFP